MKVTIKDIDEEAIQFLDTNKFNKQNRITIILAFLFIVLGITFPFFILKIFETSIVIISPLSITMFFLIFGSLLFIIFSIIFFIIYWKTHHERIRLLKYCLNNTKLRKELAELKEREQKQKATTITEKKAEET